MNLDNNRPSGVCSIKHCIQDSFNVPLVYIMQLKKSNELIKLYAHWLMLELISDNYTQASSAYTHTHTIESYAFYTMEPYLCLLNIPLQMWSLFREGFLLDCRMTKLAFSATQELASSGIEVQWKGNSLGKTCCIWVWWSGVHKLSI